MAGIETTGMARGALRLFGPRSECIGPYELLEPLGRGSSGVVYRARDHRLGRDVAIKLVPGRELDCRRISESRLLARMAHPNVLAVYDVGSCVEGSYQVTELVDGEDLRAWMQAQPEASLQSRCRLLLDVARALEFVHRHGIVHRDVKPANILVGRDGRARLADFGVAREYVELDALQTTEHGEGARVPTGDTRRTGTPCYMAPEQHRGGPVDVRADQFAFCITAVELLTGRRPFVGPDERSLAEAKCGQRVALPDVRPLRLRRVLARGLSADPRCRWDCWAPIVGALEASSGRRRTTWGVTALIGGAAIAVATTMGLSNPTAALEAMPWPSTPAEHASPQASAASLLARARADIEASRPSALKTIEEAYFTATSANEPEVAFEAALVRAELALHLMNADVAAQWLDIARSRPIALSCEQRLRLRYRSAQVKATRTFRGIGAGGHVELPGLTDALAGPSCPSASDALRLSARALKETVDGDIEQAATTMAALLEQPPEAQDAVLHAEARLTATHLQLLLQRPARAEAMARQALAQAEQHSVARATAEEQLGRALMQRGDDDSEAHLQQAGEMFIALAEHWHAPWFRLRGHDILARVALGNGQPEVAQSHAWRSFEAWNEDNPQEKTPANRQLLLVHVEVALGQRASALQRLEDLVADRDALHPSEYVVAMVELARVHAAEGNRARALDAIGVAREGLAALPDNPPMLAFLDRVESGLQ